MPEIIARISPLADVALQGRFGADKGAPGVELSLRHPETIVTVIARKGKAKALAEALKALRGSQVQWAGADQYYVLGMDFAWGGLGNAGGSHGPDEWCSIDGLKALQKSVATFLTAFAAY